MSVEKEYEELKSKIKDRKKDFDDFINFLETKTKWLTAPASVRYHLSEKKGLLKHSVGVAKTLLKLRELLTPQLSEEIFEVPSGPAMIVLSAIKLSSCSKSTNPSPSTSR